MSYELVVKEEAVVELEDAFFWYEKEKEGLGWEFIAAVERYYGKIMENPHWYQKVDKDRRVAVMRRFPYKIVYEVEQETAVVYAVFHTSRNPNNLNR